MPKSTQTTAKPTDGDADGNNATTATTTTVTPDTPNPDYVFRYRPPWTSFVPTVLLFALLNYMVITAAITPQDPQDPRLRPLPTYLNKYFPPSSSSSSFSRLLRGGFLFFEEAIVDSFYRLGIAIFRSQARLQTLTLLAWLIHCFETGVCVRVCLACRCPARHAARYLLCTAVGGFGQLMPLLAERDEYVRHHPEVKGGGSTTEKKENNGKKKENASGGNGVSGAAAKKKN